MRSLRLPCLLALLLVLAPAATAQEPYRGNLAFYDVRYDDMLAEGETGKVRMSFQFDQRMFELREGHYVGMTFEDVQVRVTAFWPEGSGPVLAGATLDLGDVGIGYHRYEFVLDLPPLYSYCLEILLDGFGFQTEKVHCVASSWEGEAALCARDAIVYRPGDLSCLGAYLP